MERTISHIDGWFASRGWTPFPFQREVWQRYAAGESGLIHASTGTGKTYAAWMGPVAAALEDAARSGLRVLWITPLRALASDTLNALRAPVADLGVPWRVEMRTGDTSYAVKARQKRDLPEALVTTPESLTVLLSYFGLQDDLAGLHTVIVDEWHELLGSKRGVQTELALARLRALNPDLRIWGLSATLGNLDEAARALIGVNTADPAIIRGAVPKKIIIDTLLPDEVERFPWAGHLGISMLPRVIAELDASRSVLVFTNTRSQTELWYRALLEARPDLAGIAALHHGSLDRKTRTWVEDSLSEGRLRCVISTSSLDLGVDFSPVDRVFQVGSPKGIARLLQRAGRSGHSPGLPSRVTGVPAHALELIEFAAARRAAAQGIIEARGPLQKPLDVLVQHVITMAMGSGFTPDALFAEVRSTYAYRDLSRGEFDWVLDFAETGGDSLRAYDAYRRIVCHDGRYIAASDEAARRHRMMIGTITSDAMVTVAYQRGPSLGAVEESFITRLKPGDTFFFAGRTLELIRIRDMKAYVRLARNADAPVPRWLGGQMPLSTQLADAVRTLIDDIQRGRCPDPEVEALAPILDLQRRWSKLPAAGELLVERTTSREGVHLFFFPFEGRMVHEGLSALISYRMSRIRPITFGSSFTDYGFELLSADEPPLEEAFAGELFSTENLVADIEASLNAAEMAKRQFRDIARIAGLVFQGFPGRGKSAAQLQASSGLLFDVFARHDPGNLLLEQARREVLRHQLEEPRLRAALERLQTATITITDTPRISPFAFPIYVDRIRQRVSSEKLSERVRRLQAALEKAASW